MASTEGGDRSLLTSSDSGQTARFGGGSTAGEESFAMPVAAGEAEIELPAIEDGDDSHIDADSYVIAESVVASLTSSVTASHVLGISGSSESRQKSRSPPREIMDRPGRSQQGSPPSRGTVRSGARPANTPSRMAAIANDEFLSPMTRQSSSRSIRSDPFGALASTTAEQASAHMDASMQKDPCKRPSGLGTTRWTRSGFTPSCARWFYVATARRAQPPLPPPESAPPSTGMGKLFEERMRELSAKSPEV